MRLSLPCSAESLLPHRAPMLLIDTLDEVTENSARTELIPNRDHLFANADGWLDPLTFVEMLAQLTAAYNGYLGLSSGLQYHMGYLVGLKHFIIKKISRVGDGLLLSVNKETQFENVSYIKGIITRQDEILAHGSLKLWEQTAPSAGGPGSATRSNAVVTRNIPDDLEPWQKRSTLHRQIITCIQEMTLQKEKAVAKLSLHPEFIGFKGHFPGYPILPGVIMLKIAMVISEIFNEAPLTLKEIKVAKFAKTIFPGAHIDIRCDFAVKGSCKQFETVIREKGKTCSRMVMVTEP